MSGNRQQRRSGATPRATDRTAERYGTPVRRNALAPGLLGAIALLAGLALIGGTGFIIIEYAVCILAGILAVYAYQARAFQAKHWWWIPVFVAIAVLWNPLWPFSFTGRIWLVAQIAGAAVFVLAAVLIKQPDPDTNRA